MKNVLVILMMSILLIGCTLDNATGDSRERHERYEIIEPESALPRGDRVFGVNISESQEGFMPSFKKAQEAGIGIVEINLPWTYFETEEGVYADPENILTDITLYADHHIQVSFSLALINTVAWEVPGYLDGVAPNSSEFIEAFENVIDFIFTTIPDEVDVPVISIGNEVDLVLDGVEEWQRYTEFYESAVDYLHTQYPEIRVGVKTTVIGGLFGEDRDEIQMINHYSDIVLLNYYPQDEAFRVQTPTAVYDDFGQIVSDFLNEEIWITEVGYQSGSTYCHSSERKQAQFFHHLFAAWDQYNDHIKAIQIDWLHDQAPHTIQAWKRYYGSDPALVEFLSTLGLRNYNGTDKPAWLQVKREAHARGW
jgi:hypothetical protein